MAKPPYELDFFEDAGGDKPCLRWIKEELTVEKRRIIGVAMEKVLQQHGMNVCEEKSWGRQLGDGVFEFRIDRTQTITVKDRRGRKRKKTLKVVLRVFCHAHGQKRILLLHGYDKGESPSSSRQQREIRVAKARLRGWKQQRRKQARRPKRRKP